MTKKRMLTFFGVILVALLSVCCVFSVACKKDKEEEHEHNYSETAYDDTYHWNYCPDDKEIDESTKAEHTLVAGTPVAATCTEEGYTPMTCECGYSSKADIVDALGHSYTADSAITYDWTKFDETDLTNHGVTATVTCVRCTVTKTIESSAITVVAGTEEGTYIATATDGDVTFKSDSYSVTPDTGTTQPQNIYTVIVSASATEIEIDGSVTLTATVDSVASTDVVLSQSSTDGGSVTINGMTITGATAGTVVITATYTDANGDYGADSVTITVKTASTPAATVTDVTLDKTELTLSLDINGQATGEVVATVTMSDGTSAYSGTLSFTTVEGVTFGQTNNNGTVAITVDASVATVAEGVEVTVTAADGISAAFTLIVNAYTGILTAPTAEVEWQNVKWNPNSGITLTESEEQQDETVLYKVSGEASTMSAEQATAYWADVAKEGDLYIYLEVVVHPGETMTWSNNTQKPYTNNTEADDIGQFIIGIYNGGSWSFTISSGVESETVSTTYVVDFSGITNLPETAIITSVADLEAAFANGGSYELRTDVEGSFTVVSGAEVTLDLNGHTVSTEEELSEATNTITVESGASLTIIGTTGAIVNTYTGAASTNNAAAIYTKGTVVINGGSVESSSVGIRAQAGSVTITNATVSSTYFTIWTDAGNVTVTINKGSAIEGKNKGIFLGGDNGNFGISSSEVAADAKSTLIVNGGTISCENESAISTLGKSNADSVVIVIYDGEISGTTTIPAETVTGAAPAIYMANGTLYVVGGTITGTTAIEVRGGSTTIYGGTLISTADPLNEEQQAENTDHGATTYGYSLAVFPYGQGVTVAGKSGYADNGVTVTVYGGTFEGAVYGVDEETYSANSDTASYTWVGYTFAITGGTFSADPSDFVPDDDYDVIGYDADGIETDTDVDHYVVKATTGEEETADDDTSTPITVTFDGVEVKEYTDGFSLYDDGETKVYVNASNGTTTKQDDQGTDYAANNQSVTVKTSEVTAADGTTFKTKLTSNGAGKASQSGSYRDFEVTVTGACTITIYVRSAGSSTSRPIYLYNELDTTTTIDTISEIPANSETVTSYEFTITEAGTYYIVPGDNIDFYGIVITYTTDSAELEG